MNESDLKDRITNHKGVQDVPTMKESGYIHIGSLFPDISGQDMSIGSHGSKGSFSICQGQAEGQPVQSG